MNVLVACEESQRVCMAFRVKGAHKMYRDIYTWNVMDEIEKGKLVCVTDRQKGENFYQFYCYEENEKEVEQDA